MPFKTLKKNHNQRLVRLVGMLLLITVFASSLHLPGNVAPAYHGGAVAQTSGQNEEKSDLKLPVWDAENPRDFVDKCMDLVVSFYQQGDFEKSVACMMHAFNTIKKELGDRHFLVGVVCGNYAHLLYSLKMYEAAEKWQLQCVEILKENFGEKGWSVRRQLVKLEEIRREKSEGVQQ